MNPKENDVVTVQYIGRLGRGHHRAYCSGVGEVYYLELVDVPNSKVEELINSGEWRQVGDICFHIKMNGQFCSNLKVEGSHLCQSCLDFFSERAKQIWSLSHGCSTTT
jgi:hypothetical protein